MVSWMIRFLPKARFGLMPDLVCCLHELLAVPFVGQSKIWIVACTSWWLFRLLPRARFGLLPARVGAFGF